MKKKVWIWLTVILLIVMILACAASYALFRFNVTKNTNFKLVVGSLELSVTDTTTEDRYILENTVPTKDEIALTQDGYTFTLTNIGTIDSFYTIYLDDILLSDGGDRLDNQYLKLNLWNHTTNTSKTTNLSDYSSTDRVLTTGYLNTGESITYTLRMWVDYTAGNEAQNKYFATQIRVVGTQQNAAEYRETILNGADPVLTDHLVPVQIVEDGTVTKADTTSQWYSYEKKNWANAVVLKDKGITYQNGETIPEDNIESYFVWIPKYSYQLWDLGNYSSLTSIEAKEQTIPIKFGLTNTSDSNTGECTTPGVAGSSGSCQVGDYMTHPAFLAFDSNGFWVGKFETGYEGATSTSDAQVNSNDSSKIIIKPNVYSWRDLTLGNMFSASYNYIRSDESHMMKNTEWGAVAYLQHSAYGSQTSVRVNNNSAYITGYAGIEDPTVGNSSTSIEGNRHESTALGVDGTYTVNYLNSLSNVASTTGNKSGIYDMSGGAWDTVMGYSSGVSATGGSSGITSIYPDFFTNSSWNQYYDEYTSTTVHNYNNRILGDATGEMGSFGSQKDPDSVTRYQSSWYGDYGQFVNSSSHFAGTWFYRGGRPTTGSSSGNFAFSPASGAKVTYSSFRIVLTP